MSRSKPSVRKQAAGRQLEFLTRARGGLPFHNHGRASGYPKHIAGAIAHDRQFEPTALADDRQVGHRGLGVVRAEYPRRFVLVAHDGNALVSRDIPELFDRNVGHQIARFAKFHDNAFDFSGHKRISAGG